MIIGFLIRIFQKTENFISKLLKKKFTPKPFVFFNKKCNGRCIYCLAVNDVAMTEDEINQVLAAGFNEISILGGEPLLCKDLEERVRKIALSGVSKIHLFTNALLLIRKKGWIPLFPQA